MSLFCRQLACQGFHFFIKLSSFIMTFFNILPLNFTSSLIKLLSWLIAILCQCTCEQSLVLWSVSESRFSKSFYHVQSRIRLYGDDSTLRFQSLFSFEFILCPQMCIYLSFNELSGWRFVYIISILHLPHDFLEIF